MRYYEVLPADSKYHGNAALTYSFEAKLPPLSVVSIPLRNGQTVGFVENETTKPSFTVRPIKELISKKPLPSHCLQLALWLKEYYATDLGNALRQFAPSRAALKKLAEEPLVPLPAIKTNQPLTQEQKSAVEAISNSPHVTSLLHGETGSGKTRVYMELAKKSLADGRSVIILTPEISLTSQLYKVAKQSLKAKIYILHSQLTLNARRKIWLDMLEASEPVVVVGARSALFAPLASIGLIVVDESHEPAYKQDQSPRYHASRVASQLGNLVGAKVVLGSATPTVTDYYLAGQKKAVVRMTELARGDMGEIKSDIVDLKNRSNFAINGHLSNQLIEAIKSTISAKKQVILYLNRRGSARLILCNVCGWTFYCPNCDVPLTYHADQHLARCHICGFRESPPSSCPKCNNPDIIYKSQGTKAIADTVARMFPNAKVARFDSDNVSGERVNDLYGDLVSGQIDILVGTQLIAKGLDLPKLELVGVISAEASLALPDFTAEERSFQLLYQVVGRVGRGHGKGQVIVQAYDPTNTVIGAALGRDWSAFYDHCLQERSRFRFPPFSYLLRLSCRRATEAGAKKASDNLRKIILAISLPVEVIGPTPSFYARRGKYYYYQLIIKSKERAHLLKIVAQTPSDWSVDIDPVNLL